MREKRLLILLTNWKKYDIKIRVKLKRNEQSHEKTESILHMKIRAKLKRKGSKTWQQNELSRGQTEIIYDMKSIRQNWRKTTAKQDRKTSNTTDKMERLTTWKIEQAKLKRNQSKTWQLNQQYLGKTESIYHMEIRAKLRGNDNKTW